MNNMFILNPVTQLYVGLYVLNKNYSGMTPTILVAL